MFWPFEITALLSQSKFYLSILNIHLSLITISLYNKFLLILIIIIAFIQINFKFNITSISFELYFKIKNVFSIIENKNVIKRFIKMTAYIKNILASISNILKQIT